MPDEVTDPDVMTPEEEPPPGDDEEVADGVWRSPDPRVRVIRRPPGPRPLDELRAEHGLGHEQPDQQMPRTRWVARQLATGRRPTEIDRDGARLYGVTERTIARDRQDLRQTREGTDR